ncbi:MAG: MFS transporter [Armatimonadota bacterium]|nr:MFS transporter [Armatimonadota bacterium]
MGDSVGEAAKPVPAGFLTLMRNRNYALLWTGQLVSQMGDRFHWLAISLWVYALTGSAIHVSLAMTAMTFGRVPFGLLSGVLVDRLNRKTVLIVSDLARAIVVATIPFLIVYSIWYVYVAIFLVSSASVFFRPAMFAVIPQVVRKEDLMPANSFFSAMDTATEVIGPILAGVVVMRMGYATALYLDAASYVVSALLVLAMTVPPLARTVESWWGGIKKDMVEGFRYIWTHPLQRGLFLSIFVIFWVAGLNSLQTPLAKGVLGVTDVQFGFMSGVHGAGFLTASLLMGWFGGRFPKGALIIAGAIIFVLATGAAGLAPSYEALLAAMFAWGFGNIVFLISLVTLIMEITPQEIVGRVMANRQVALGVVNALALLGFGALADILGVRQSILVMAGLTLVLLLLWIWRNPAVTQDSKGWWDMLWRRVTGYVDPEYDEVQQRWLNLVTMAIVAVGWVLFTIRQPAIGFEIAGIILAAWGARKMMERLKRKE